jgi:hypothetical protein
MVDNGMLTQTELDQMIQIARETELRNMGYCFLTFSIQDEARLMLMKNDNPYLEGQ